MFQVSVFPSKVSRNGNEDVGQGAAGMMGKGLVGGFALPDATVQLFATALTGNPYVTLSSITIEGYVTAPNINWARIWRG